MPHRAPSPAASETEFDISHALFQSDNDSDNGLPQEHGVGPTIAHGRRISHDENFMGLELDDGDEDDEAFIAAQQIASNRKASNLKGRTVKKGGGFQAMGLNATLLKAITRKGFSVPTPIQRKTIPLVLDGQDVVGMARTGSGKTAAFVVPMLEKLKTHSAKVGSRALILSPSRELALQTLKVVKELGRGTDLKCVLIVGGDSLEEQFGFMTANPDIVIATPGRFLHLQVEMNLDLSSTRYVVFDEADRLFEMGFAAQLTEILHALPSSRQTLLFSATLPKSLVEFARAGLQDPNLVRLDAESKVSPDLESAFFTLKSSEKEGALLQILNDIVKMPTGSPKSSSNTEGVRDDTGSNKKRKRDSDDPKVRDAPTEHSTIVFTATKHHVDYLASLLRNSGFAVSHAYGSLDQTARRMQVEDFRTGRTNILVVTDVAARGIDIPVLANVINYDFPPQPKIFVHRVGRTARAGRRGWSYSLVRDSDAPYLLDLQLFLGRRLLVGNDEGEKADFSHDIAVGRLPRQGLEPNCEAASKMLDEDSELAALRGVAVKGEKLYIRTRNASSAESAKRSKQIVSSDSWTSMNPLFRNSTDTRELKREEMLARVSGFRPQETVFEIGKRGNNSETAEMMRKRRAKLERKRPSGPFDDETNTQSSTEGIDIVVAGTAERLDDGDAMVIEEPTSVADLDSASEEELEVTFSQSMSTKGTKEGKAWKDSEHFMSYTPTAINMAEDRGYGVHSGGNNASVQNSNFVQAAGGVTMDLNNDDGAKAFGEPSRNLGKRWDKRHKKYVSRANDEDGSKGAKMIRGESGQKIAASFRSGRFDSWRKSNKIDRMPRTGESESASVGSVGRRFRHKQERAPKAADKYRDDYYKKKKRLEQTQGEQRGTRRPERAKPELKSVDEVRKQRQVKEKRRDKNARPSKKRKG
ncbi:MAG: ATP-dependent RNA helicase dbp10 [Piccolia ochrophora]|nr:MAG: ATP-dependent RNA helicase dbp10 [Piccolia ochrophora]